MFASISDAAHIPISWTMDSLTTNITHKDPKSHETVLSGGRSASDNGNDCEPRRLPSSSRFASACESTLCERVWLLTLYVRWFWHFQKIFSHLSSDVFVPRIPDVPTLLRWMFLGKEDKLQNLKDITLTEIQAVYPSCFWLIVSLMPKAPSWVGRRWGGRRSRKRTRLLEGRWSEVNWNWRGDEVRKRSRSWLWRSR